MNRVMKYIFHGLSVHVVTGAAEDCGEMMSAMPFLLFSRSDFQTEEENENEESEEAEDSSSSEGHLVMKSLNLQQFQLLRRYVLELHKLFQCGATLDLNSQQGSHVLNSEECPICLDANVEVVLPCTHSFCSKCYEDWKSQNPTCPFCRVDIISSQESGGDETWSIEDCDKDMNLVAAEMYETTVKFLRSLPDWKPTEMRIRTFPPLQNQFAHEETLARISA